MRGIVASTLVSAAYATVLDPLAAAPLLVGAVLAGGSCRAVIGTALLTLLVFTVLRLVQHAVAALADRLGIGAERAARAVVALTSGIIVLTAVVVVVANR